MMFFGVAKMDGDTVRVAVEENKIGILVRSPDGEIKALNYIFEVDNLVLLIDLYPSSRSRYVRMYGCKVYRLYPKYHPFELFEQIRKSRRWGAPEEESTEESQREVVEMVRSFLDKVTGVKIFEAEGEEFLAR